MISRPNKALIGALYVNAALLAGILLAVASRDNGSTLVPAALAQNQPPIAGGAGVFMMPAQFSTNTWGVYLMDVDQQTLSAYQYLPGEHQLRLVAARNFRYDRKLGNFNTANPSPLEVKDLVEKEAAGIRGANPQVPPPPH